MVLPTGDPSCLLSCAVQAAQERRKQLMQVTDVLRSKMAGLQSGEAGSSAAVK